MMPSPSSSKLFIRSEVLAVIEFLTAVEDAPKHDKLKEVRRLSKIEDRATVLEILVKELRRANGARGLQAVSELLMELGTIEHLQNPLWTLIRGEDASDEVKDAANLILRHLGDETDPDLYLEYLDDPQGLISRETERMLQVSASNPEALIDFIDFIFSLPEEEQCNLLNSLQADYPPEYLLNIYMPALLADPPARVRELVLKNMGGTRTKGSALFLHQMLDYFSGDEELLKIIKRSINELKLAGLYREDQFDEYRRELAVPHAVTQSTEPYKCYATLSDGVGNQGMVFSRRRENGDICLMSVAVNDTHGIIDCFGFFQLSEEDFGKISGKFHEESRKIDVSPSYCRQKLLFAESLNRQQRFRTPYEYTCWKILMDDIPDEPLDVVEHCRQWVNPAWTGSTANLYQHPDFQTWFLEEGDHPVVTEVLTDVKAASLEALERGLSPAAFHDTMEVLAEAIVRGLMASEWRDALVRRLADAAYLLDKSETQTFRALAATEARQLLNYQPGTPLEQGGFLRQYGRRCVEEQLLRLKPMTEEFAGIVPLADYVLEQWTL